MPYAILCLFFLTIFVVLPTLVLTLYPFQFLHKFLSIFPMHWHFLYAFVDTFQGCYKDGTELGTVDCQWFAQFGLFLRLAFFVIYVLTLSSIFFVYAAIVSTLWLILLISVNPFKKHDIVSSYLLMDSVFLVLFTLLCISIPGRDIASIELTDHVYLRVMNVFATLSPFATVLYVLYIMLHWMYTWRKCGRELFRSISSGSS